MGRAKEIAFELGAFDSPDDDKEWYCDDYDGDDEFEEEPETERKPTAQEKKNREKHYHQLRVCGFISEDFIRCKLNLDGFAVCKVATYDYNSKRHVFNEKAVEDFLGKLRGKATIVSLLKEIERGWPDFICLKKDRVYFVEVKSNNSKLNDAQQEAIKTLQDAGYKTYVRRVKVSWQEKEIEEKKQKK